MVELVVNKCWGGFSLSELACETLGLSNPYEDIARDDYRLVATVRLLGEKANGRHARLEIVELPFETTDWHIEDYDGCETVIYVVDGKLHFA